MNALVSFRTNGVGHLSPTAAQRQASAERVASNLAARIAGVGRANANSSVSTAKMVLHDTAAGPAAQDSGFSRDAFLQLLVLELQHQDPTDPLSNREMVSQLAQFSALEAAMNLNKLFEDFSNAFDAYAGNLDQLNFIAAQGMLGNYVEGFDANGEPITGTVESVHLDGSIVVLSIDGRNVPMSSVTGVATTRPEDGGT